MTFQVKLLKSKVVTGLAGHSRAKLYLDVDEGTFVPPVKYGVSSFWIEKEVMACLEAKIAGLSKDEMKEFVQQLLKSRITKDELKNKYSHHQLKKDSQPGEKLEVAHG